MLYELIFAFLQSFKFVYKNTEEILINKIVSGRSRQSWIIYRNWLRFRVGEIIGIWNQKQEIVHSVFLSFSRIKYLLIMDAIVFALFGGVFTRRRLLCRINFDMRQDLFSHPSRWVIRIAEIAKYGNRCDTMRR